MRENKIIVLVDKVDFETYKNLKKDNIYPLVVEADGFDMYNDEAYKKDENIYTLKIQFLKSHYWRRANQAKGISFEKDIIKVQSDGTIFEIINPIEAAETEYNQDGFIVNYPLSAQAFISLNCLIEWIGIRNKNDWEIKEGETIYSEIADFHSYEIMRSNKVLPIAVVLTEFQSKLVSIPFDGLYNKANIAYGKCIMTLDLTLLNKMVIDGRIKLKGIKLEDGNVYKINRILAPDSDNSLGTLSLEEQELDIMRYTKKLLEPKEFKSSSHQSEKYYSY